MPILLEIMEDVNHIGNHGRCQSCWKSWKMSIMFEIMEDANYVGNHGRCQSCWKSWKMSIMLEIMEDVNHVGNHGRRNHVGNHGRCQSCWKSWKMPIMLEIMEDANHVGSHGRCLHQRLPFKQSPFMLIMLFSTLLTVCAVLPGKAAQTVSTLTDRNSSVGAAKVDVRLRDGGHADLVEGTGEEGGECRHKRDGPTPRLAADSDADEILLGNEALDESVRELVLPPTDTNCHTITAPTARRKGELDW